MSVLDDKKCFKFSLKSVVLHEKDFVLDVLNHIGRIYSPLNLGNMEIQKLKFAWNSACK